MTTQASPNDLRGFAVRTSLRAGALPRPRPAPAPTPTPPAPEIKLKSAWEDMR